MIVVGFSKDFGFISRFDEKSDELAIAWDDRRGIGSFVRGDES